MGKESNSRKANMLANKELLCGILFAGAWASVHAVVIMGLFTDAPSSAIGPALPWLFMISIFAVVVTSCLILLVQETDDHVR